MYSLQYVQLGRIDTSLGLCVLVLLLRLAQCVKALNLVSWDNMGIRQFHTTCERKLIVVIRISGHPETSCCFSQELSMSRECVERKKQSDIEFIFLSYKTQMHKHTTVFCFVLYLDHVELCVTRALVKFCFPFPSC